MAQFTKGTIDFLFNRSMVRFEDKIGLFMERASIDLQRSIEDMRARGMDDDAILDTLEADFSQVNEKGRRGGTETSGIYTGLFDAATTELKLLEREVSNHRLNRSVLREDPETGEITEIVRL